MIRCPLIRALERGKFFFSFYFGYCVEGWAGNFWGKGGYKGGCGGSGFEGEGQRIQYYFHNFLF
jgi:hypothetical protein